MKKQDILNFLLEHKLQVLIILLLPYILLLIYFATGKIYTITLLVATAVTFVYIIIRCNNFKIDRYFINNTFPINNNLNTIDNKLKNIWRDSKSTKFEKPYYSLFFDLFGIEFLGTNNLVDSRPKNILNFFKNKILDSTSNIFISTIQGVPGSGKSSLLRELSSHCQMNQEKRSKNWIPVFVVGRYISYEKIANCNGLKFFLFDYFNQLDNNKAKFIAEYYEQFRFLIIIDGLDEIVDQQHYLEIIHTLECLIQDEIDEKKKETYRGFFHSTNRYIISYRQDKEISILFNNHQYSNHVRHFTLIPLKHNSVIYLKKFFKYYSKKLKMDGSLPGQKSEMEKLTKIYENVCRLISNQNELEEIFKYYMTNPYLLSIILEHYDVSNGAAENLKRIFEKVSKNESEEGCEIEKNQWYRDYLAAIDMDKKGIENEEVVDFLYSSKMNDAFKILGTITREPEKLMKSFLDIFNKIENDIQAVKSDENRLFNLLKNVSETVMFFPGRERDINYLKDDIVRLKEVIQALFTKIAGNTEPRSGWTIFIIRYLKAMRNLYHCGFLGNFLRIKNPFADKIKNKIWKKLRYNIGARFDKYSGYLKSAKGIRTIFTFSTLKILVICSLVSFGLMFANLFFLKVYKPELFSSKFCSKIFYFGIITSFFIILSLSCILLEKVRNILGFKEINRMKESFNDLLDLISSNRYSWKVNEEAINLLKEIVPIEVESVVEISNAAEKCLSRYGVIKEKTGLALLDVANQVAERLNEQENRPPATATALNY